MPALNKHQSGGQGVVEYQERDHEGLDSFQVVLDTHGWELNKVESHNDGKCHIQRVLIHTMEHFPS